MLDDGRAEFERWKRDPRGRTLAFVCTDMSSRYPCVPDPFADAFIAVDGPFPKDPWGERVKFVRACAGSWTTGDLAGYDDCVWPLALQKLEAYVNKKIVACGPEAATLEHGLAHPPGAAPAWSLDTEIGQTPTVDEMARRIAGTNAFMVAVDENGRPYVIDDSGRPRAISTLPVLADRLKLGGRFDVLSDQGLIAQEIADLVGDAAAADKTIAGITGADAAAHARTLSPHEYIVFDRNGLTHYLPGGQVIIASSEHSSIRGTINGGGDFVKSDPPSATPEVLQFHGQGPSVSFDPTGTKFAVEVGYNGVSAIAVLEGTVKVTERATGRAASVSAGSAVVSVPGRGVTRVFPLSSKASASLGRPMSSPLQEARVASSGGWSLTGTWLDQANGVYVVTQSGSTVTWSAHAADNRQWGHTFTGTINGDMVEGDFQDVPPYPIRLSGHIKLRIVDATHMTLVSSSGPFGASAWTRQTPVPPEASIPVTSAPEPTVTVPARILGLTAAHAVRGGRPVGATETFTPDDGPIYVWFQHEGCPAGTIVKSDWYFLGSDPSTHIGDVTITVGPVGNWGQFNLELAPGKRWPAGDYRVDLTVHNTVAASTRFRVVSAGAGNEPRVYRHPSAGYQLVVPSGWSLSDDAAPADVRLTAPDGAGMIEITSGRVSVKVDPVSYAAGWESRAVGPTEVLRVKRAGRVLDVDGQPAYAGTYEGAEAISKVVFVSYPDHFVVLAGTFATSGFAAGEAVFDRVIEGFRGR